MDERKESEVNCKYCGGTLTLEEKYCPHCGKPNEHAQQHAKDMESYKSRFDTTQGDVYKVTKNFSEITAHAVIITVLVVLCLAALGITANAYSIRRSVRDSQSRRHYEEYTARMNQYLQEEDYLGFDAFCEEHGIRTYTEGYEDYSAIITAAGHYVYIYENLIGLLEAEAESIKESRVESLAEYCDNFSRAREKLEYYPDSREYSEQVIDRMEKDLEALWQAYFGLTAEEAEAFPNMGKGQKMMLMEQKYEEMGYDARLTE